jgi:hypothetical protein
MSFSLPPAIPSHSDEPFRLRLNPDGFLALGRMRLLSVLNAI